MLLSESLLFLLFQQRDLGKRKTGPVVYLAPTAWHTCTHMSPYLIPTATPQVPPVTIPLVQTAGAWGGAESWPRSRGSAAVKAGRAGGRGQCLCLAALSCRGLGRAVNEWASKEQSGGPAPHPQGPQQALGLPHGYPVSTSSEGWGGGHCAWGSALQHPKSPLHGQEPHGTRVAGRRHCSPDQGSLAHDRLFSTGAVRGEKSGSVFLPGLSVSTYLILSLCKGLYFLVTFKLWSSKSFFF